MPERSVEDIVAEVYAPPPAGTRTADDIAAEYYPEAADDRPWVIKGISKLPFPKRLNDRLIVTPWEKQKQLWKESGDIKDHLKDFYDPENYENYKEYEENAEYVNEHYNYPTRAALKEFLRRWECFERGNDKDNPKWQKDNNRCD